MNKLPVVFVVVLSCSVGKCRNPPPDILRYLLLDNGLESLNTLLMQSVSSAVILGGGHWGVLNTATPQKIDKNTASPREKLTKHRHRNIFSDFMINMVYMAF